MNPSLCIIFETRAIADEIITAIAATPYEGVWLHYDPDVGWYDIDPETEEQIWIEAPNQVQQVVSSDGRVAIIHRWGQEDVDWLRGYCEGIKGIIFVDSLPDDWG